MNLPFATTIPHDVSQMLKGPIKRYVDGELVSSEEWKEMTGEETDGEEEKQVDARPREEDGIYKRKKAVARGKQEGEVSILNHLNV